MQDTGCSGLLMVLPGAENRALFTILTRVRTFCSLISKGKSSFTWPESERIYLLICFIALNNDIDMQNLTAPS